MSVAVESENKIKIKRLAVNVIDLKLPVANISEKLFPLNEENEIIDNFFQTHFTDTREGKSTKSCKFTVSDATVQIKVKRYYESRVEEDFLILSKELTENLFNIMKTSSSTSSGTFFVMDVEYNNEECIFLIKLDPKHGIQINPKDLTISVLEDILPDSNDRVHKCAIIRHKKPENSQVELFVMDKQQKEGEPARFFIETYLQAEELLNDKLITKEVIKSTREKVLNILPSIDPNKISESIDKEFTNGARIQLKIALQNILENTVPSNTKDREVFIEKSVSEFVDEYLEKNPDHQTSFIVDRKDNVLIWRAEKNQVFFRYNKGIGSQISVTQDNSGNTIIKVDNSLNFTRDYK